MVTVRDVASGWGVPPWVVTGEQPTEAVVSLWATREIVLRRLGVPHG
jgi:hypothetical protein